MPEQTGKGGRAGHDQREQCRPERSEGGHARYSPLHFVQGDTGSPSHYFIASRISPAAAMALSTSRERALACWVAWVRSPSTAATPAERRRSRSNRTFCM